MEIAISRRKAQVQDAVALVVELSVWKRSRYECWRRDVGMRRRLLVEKGMDAIVVALDAYGI